MRHRPHHGLVRAPSLDRLRQRGLRSIGQMPIHRVLANDQGQLNLLHLGQKCFSPSFGTFRTRRQVAGFSRAGITESHGNNGDAGRVVKCGAVNSHPCSQTVPARIVKWNARFVNPPTRCLPCNQNACRGRDLENRTRSKGKMGCAEGAGPYLSFQLGEGPLRDRPGLKFGWQCSRYL